MMHRRIDSRLMALAVAAALAPAAKVAVAAPTTVQAAAQVDVAQCGFHAMLASKEGDRGVPKELAAFTAQLTADELAIYKSFYFIEHQRLDARTGEKLQVTFVTGHRIALTLLGFADEKIKIWFDLSDREGVKSLLSTTLSMIDGGVVMARAGTYEHEGVSGKLIFAIQCTRG